MGDPRFDDVIREASSFATPAECLAWLRGPEIPTPLKAGEGQGHRNGPTHGRVSTYVSGCRCEACRAGWSAYNRTRRRRVYTGGPS